MLPKWPTCFHPRLVLFIDIYTWLLQLAEGGRCTAFTLGTTRFTASQIIAALGSEPDMPLTLDKPVNFGVQDFCEKCHLCANYCPVGAISHGDKEVVRGIRRWAYDGDKCRRYWSRLGSSCTICVTVCPWSHPNNLIHDTVRELAERFSSLRKLLIKGETLVYGKYKPSPDPDWIKSKGTKDTY